MASLELKLTVRFPLWWRFIYWPLVMLGIWFGLPLNPNRVRNDAEKAIRIYSPKGNRLR